MFPGLHLRREAFLTAVEFETLELRQPVQLRLQVYRPSGAEGGAPAGARSWGLSMASEPPHVCWPPAQGGQNRSVGLCRDLWPGVQAGHAVLGETAAWARHHPGPCPAPLLAGASGNLTEPASRSLENKLQPATEGLTEGCSCPGGQGCLPRDCANRSASGLWRPAAAYVLWREFLLAVPAGPPAYYSVRVLAESPWDPATRLARLWVFTLDAQMRFSPAFQAHFPPAPSLGASWEPRFPTSRLVSQALWVFSSQGHPPHLRVAVMWVSASTSTQCCWGP